MQAFRHALDDSLHSESSAELISAVTDFIPVQQTPTKRTRKTQRRRYNGYSYTLLRVPLMVWLSPLYLTMSFVLIYLTLIYMINPRHTFF